MITLPAILDSFLKAGEAVREFARWKNIQNGKGKLLVIELQNNFTYLEMVSRGEAHLDEVLIHVSTDKYKSLLSEGFKFESVVRGKIRNAPSLKGSRLQSWAGRDAVDLLDSLYNRIDDLKIRYPHNRDNKRYNWNLRINNILRMIMLLLNHRKNG